jgi:hypothetical protein
MDIICNVNVYQFLYKPGQTLNVPGGSRSQIPRQAAKEGGKIVCPTHRSPLPSRKYSCYSFCPRMSRLQDHRAAGRIMSMKNSSDTIENRTRDLPACRAVLQLTAPPRCPFNMKCIVQCLILHNFVLNLKKNL